MKIRSKIRTFVSLLLAVTMIIPQNITAFAALKVPETALSGERIATASDADSFVYFGAEELNTEEAAGIYQIPVYRGGDLTGPASVTVRTIDIAALYGKDYRLLGDNKTEYRSEETLLERVAHAEATDEILTYDYDVETGELKDTGKAKISDYQNGILEDIGKATPSNYDNTETEEADVLGTGSEEVFEVSETEEIAMPSDYEIENVTEKSSSGTGEPEETEEIAEKSPLMTSVNLPAGGKSLLAMEKEAELGITAREPEKTVSNSLAEAICSRLLPEAMLRVPYSSEQEIFFEDGQDEAEITVKILDDNLSEGPEMFTILMVSAENMTVLDSRNTFSVTIEDDEADVLSAISFDAADYVIENGKIRLKLLREEAEYTIAAATVRHIDAETGKETDLGIAAFAPYEKELEEEIAVPGEGEIVLCDFDSAREGAITSAVLTRQDAEPEWTEAEFLSASGDTLSCTIKISGQEYRMDYQKNSDVGTIFDTRFSPELEVGKYYICADKSHNGMFSFEKTGSSPGWTGSWSARYENKSGDTGDLRKSFAYLYYYSAWTRDKGTCASYIKLADSKISGPLYQALFPDWEQECYAFGGQRSYFDVDTEQDGNKSPNVGYEWRKSDFGRSIDTGHGVRIKDVNGKLTVRASVRDVEKNMTPKLRMKFYGVVCMYKRYRVKMTAPDPITVKTGLRPDGTYDTVSIVPAISKVKCGAQTINGPQEERDMYANADPEKSNMVFELGANEIYGVSHIYGKIKGYRITISPEEAVDDRVVLQYPADFFSFLSGRTGSSTGAIDYSAEAVEAEKRKVENNLQTVPFDVYFIDWIESSQKKIYETSEFSNKGYFQKLSFQPVMEAAEVSVTVQIPSGSLAGHFADPNLKASATAYTYHAGDRLDLSAVAEDTANYEAAGYEVSVDGGKFNTIRSEKYLLLEPDHAYRIRPLITQKKNYIEVLADSADLTVLGTVPAELLLPYPDLAGKCILDLNPQKANIYDRIKPEAGKVYSLDILTEGKNYALVTDLETGIRYNTNKYYFVASPDRADNVFRAECVTRTAALTEYTVSGTAVLTAPALREDAQTHEVPVQGYAVSLSQGGVPAAGSRMIPVTGAVTAPDGSFTVSGIKGRPGDRIIMSIGNGVGDEQLFETVLGDEPEQNAGILALTYPKNAPSIASLTYDYAKPQSRSEGDVSKNTVQVFDDSLILNAVVNGNGREVKEVVYTLHHSDGSVAGNYTGYTESGSGETLYTCQIDDMIAVFKNGDYFTVHLVDKESGTVTVDGKAETIPILYPEVRTGLTMFTENKYVAPKELEYMLPEAYSVDLPLIGRTGGGLKSGPLGLSRTNWPDGTGYTVTMNLEGVITNMGASTQQKLDKFNEYRTKAKAVRDTKMAVAENEAEGRQLAEAGGLVEDVLLDEGEDPGDQAEREARAKELKENATQAKDNFAQISKSTVISVGVVICLEFEFVKIPEKGIYKLCEFAFTAGGTFNMSKTFYYVVGYVPAFVNVTLKVQGNYIAGQTFSEGVKEISGEAFDNYAGNIQKLLDGSHDHLFGMNQLDIIAQGKGQIGVGMCGVVSARGYIKLGIHLQALSDCLSATGDNGGFAVDVAGGIGLDLLITSIDIDVAKAAYGVGSLRKETGVSFLNDVVKVAAPAENAGALAAGYTEEITASPYAYGTDDMGAFAGNPQEEDPSGIFWTVLLKDAADRTKPEIIDLGNGKELLTFIGNREPMGRKVYDEACLYYAVRENGVWSRPEPVSDDSTFDTSADLIRVGDKAVVVWCDTNYRIDEFGNFKDKCYSFVISAAVFDPETNTFGGERTIAGEDRWFNVDPKLATDGETIYCTYLARDISGASDITELADYKELYSAVKYVKMTIGEGLDYMNQPSDCILYPEEPKFLYVRTDEEDDPLVTDLQSAMTTVEGKTWLLYSYTVDEDGDSDTVKDRQIYLWAENLTDGQEYDPIRVNRTTEGDMAPVMTELDGTVYLTWVSMGQELNLLCVNDVLHALSFDGAVLGENEESAAASEEDVRLPAEYYEKLLAEELPVESTTLSGGISEYQLCSDGKDLYVYYTDISPDPENTGRELFGMCFQKGDGETVSEDGAYQQSEQNGFSEGVQVTNYGRVLDEFDVLMYPDRSLSFVSNSYEQSISDEGKMVYGDHELIYIRYKTRDSVEIDPYTVEIPEYLVAGEKTEIRFNLVNNGLLPAEGCHITVNFVKDGRKTVICEKDLGIVLPTLGKHSVSVPWTVPEDIEGGQIEIIADETDTASENPSVYTEDLQCEANLSFEEVTAVFADGKVTVTGTVKNTGNRASGTVTVSAENNNEAELSESSVSKKAYGSVSLPALSSGEKAPFTLTFEPGTEDFDIYGRIGLLLTAAASGARKKEFRTSCNVQEPVIVSVNNGAKELSVAGKTPVQLTAKAAPWENMAGEPVFSSSDPSIAQVEKDGTVRGMRNGTAVITVYYPRNGASGTITVTVTGISDDPGRGVTSGSRISVPDGPKSAKRMTGRWVKNDAEDSWSFLNADGTAFTGWGYISYVKGFDYYHIGEDGIMDYGWYYDETEKKWYYLSEVHDGRFGAMVRGWYQDHQDGKWYYLDEKDGAMRTDWIYLKGFWYYLNPVASAFTWHQNENGEWEYGGTGRPYGSMYESETTPDGYEVNNLGRWVIK